MISKHNLQHTSRSSFHSSIETIWFDPIKYWSYSFEGPAKRLYFISAMILESLDAPQVLREDVKNLRVVSCCFCSSRQSQPTLFRCSWSCAVGKRMVLQQLGGCRFDTERVWAIAESPKKGAAPKSRDFRGRGHTWPDPWIVDLLTMITSLRFIFFPWVAESTEKRISFEGDPKQIQVLAQGQLHQRSLGATDAHWLFLNESKWKAKEAVVVPGTNGIEWVDSTLTKMHSFFRSASAVVAVVQPLFQWSCKTRAVAVIVTPSGTFTIAYRAYKAQ